MADIIAAPPGWYYCRIREGEGHIIRYPVAAWKVEAGLPVEPLLAKPGEIGLVPPSNEDRAGLVGLVPPDREYQSYFSSEDQQEAAKRLFFFLHPKEAAHYQATTVREVELPGVGKIGVRDERPQAQREQPEWVARARGSWPRSARLGSLPAGSGGDGG